MASSEPLLLQWPPGDNVNDTIIHGMHYNLTTLQHWNYTYWANETVSNVTWCQILKPPYMAERIIPNGTWINGTSCFTPVYPIGLRSGVGVGIAVVYGICLVFILINLARHGKMHIRPDKRFYPIGRRWQWYWASWVCAMALIGLFFGVDIDRYYVMEIPIIISAFAWFLMQMGTTALVWEAVRHWGSWMERQFVDPNPFVLHEKDRRGMFEFWLPLWFYMWLWLNFFMVIPRNWGPIELQRSPEQTIQKAEPTATSVRFKAAGFMLCICWLTIMVSLWHSIKHYEPRNRGWFNRAVGFLGYMPFRFVLELPLLLALIAYQILSAFDWSISPLNGKGDNIAIFVGGYVPSLLIVIIQIVDGFIRPNEDRELLRQRRVRNNEIDRELGITNKPRWWRRLNGEPDPTDMAAMVTRNVREVGGRRQTRNVVDNRTSAALASNQEPASPDEGGGIELNAMTMAERRAYISGDDLSPPPYSPQSAANKAGSGPRTNQQAMQAVAGLLFPNNAQSGTRPANDSPSAQEQGEATTLSADQRPNGQRTPSTVSGLSTAGQPQQVRSMLDI